MTIKAEVKTMALKDIFTMVKADRYTADGRDEVIKAQKAETEDRTYQNGDISQATGLMKTPNGWVKPPKGKGAKAVAQKAPSGKMSKKEVDATVNAIRGSDTPEPQNESPMQAMQRMMMSGASTEQMRSTLQGMNKDPTKGKSKAGAKPEAAKKKAPAESKPAETKTYKTRDIERVDKNNLKLGEVSATKNPDNTWSVKNAEGKEVSRALRMEDVKEAMVKSANRKPGDTKFPNVSKEQKIETLANHYRETYGKTTEEWAKTLKEVPEETLEDRYEEYAKKHPADSAPRILTGDTRIRVRK